MLADATLLEHPDAVKIDPMLVHRLRRLDERARLRHRRAQRVG